MDKIPFILNQVYKRSAIHDLYKGSRQGGISTSAEFPYIFIFSSPFGHQHGYKDAWDNKYIYSYTGAGQVGDMKFIRGNLALLNHKKNGRRVFLFTEAFRSHFKFEGEVELVSFNTQAIPDNNKNMREGISFFFKCYGVYLPVEVETVLNTPLVAADQTINYGLHIPSITERKGLVTSRVGQGAYRQRVILTWESKCAVTGFEKPEVLIASHIVPWASSTNEERVDPNNGILLSPTYDALFDRHLISFDTSGKIILADSIEIKAFNKIGVTGNEQIRKLNIDNHYYLKRHRMQFNEWL